MTTGTAHVVAVHDASVNSGAPVSAVAMTAPILVGIDGTAASWDAMSWAQDDLAARRLMTDDVLIAVRAGSLAEQLISGSTPDSTVVLAATHRDFALVTRVAAHATGVVVAVRPTTPPVDVTAGPFAGHVVVGVGDGAPAQAAIAFAFVYADRHHKPIAAVHAGAVEPAGVWVDDSRTDVHLTAYPFDLDLLEAAVNDAHDAHPDVPVRRFVLRDAAEQALVAASAGAVLLVVGDRGRNPLTRRLLGSVSRHVVRHARCSVAVVHNSGGRS